MSTARDFYGEVEPDAIITHTGPNGSQFRARADLTTNVYVIQLVPMSGSMTAADLFNFGLWFQEMIASRIPRDVEVRLNGINFVFVNSYEALIEALRAEGTLDEYDLDTYV